MLYGKVIPHQNTKKNGPGHIQAEMILRSTEDVRRAENSAVALGCGIAVQRDVLGDYASAARTSTCVFTCRSMRAYLKPAALGTLGFISSSCVISIPF